MLLCIHWSGFFESSGETEVGRRLLAPEPRPLPPLALTQQTRPRHANRTPSWTVDLRGRYFTWNWTIHVVMLATVSCGNNCNVVVKLVQECKLFDVFYFRSTETVRRERYVSWGSERLQVSARVKKRTADVVYERCLYCVAYRNFWQCSAAGSWK